MERQAELRTSKDTRVAAQRQATVLTEAMRSFVPTEMDPTTARRFSEDMYRDVTEHGQKNGWNGLTTAALPEILAFRFSQYGIDPNTIANGAPRDASGVVVAQPANEAAETIAAARGEGDRQKKQYQRRRAAGASTPSGAGTPSNRARPPKGATLGEALDWAKQSIGSG